MIVLFTDFGAHDPYVGQIKARVSTVAPLIPVIDLLHEVPAFNPHSGAHLLAALANEFPSGSVFLAVVDPGVGTAREATVVFAGGCWYVGPDNGLLSVIAGRHMDTRMWRITWRPQKLSSTFHGRDVFAVIAAEIASGEFPAEKLQSIEALNVQFDCGDLPRIIYIDHYGNAWSGVRGVQHDAHVAVAGKSFSHADSFGFVDKGAYFWFVNSVGLLELAINRGSVSEVLELKVGDPVQVQRMN